VPIFSASLKKQAVNPKKCYAIDTGLVQTVGFSVSQNKGTLLENLVFLQLRKKHDAIFYYRSVGNFEVDFMVREDKGNYMLVQVSSNLQDPRVRERELRALTAAMEELNIRRAYVYTESEREEIKQGRNQIQVLPVWEWID
jgi:predicted AAA+ superfamily ATPase